MKVHESICKVLDNDIEKIKALVLINAGILDGISPDILDELMAKKLVSFDKIDGLKTVPLKCLFIEDFTISHVIIKLIETHCNLKIVRASIVSKLVRLKKQYKCTDKEIIAALNYYFELNPVVTEFELSSLLFKMGKLNKMGRIKETSQFLKIIEKINHKTNHENEYLGE